MRSVYLDYNATTPVDPLVLEEMLHYFVQDYGNPSSIHSKGIEARKALDLARERISYFLNCEPDEVIFTSGGSESNNHAIKGLSLFLRDRGDHIITSKIEHPSVLEVFLYLESIGFKTTYVSVDKFGVIDLEELKASITPKTILISVMHSNNEIGTIEPLEEISKIAKEKAIVLHTDAAQSAGKVRLNFKKLGAGLLSIAGHKIYAPKGIGALIVKRGLKIESLLHGAHQEFGKRAGTENVPYIVALGKACEIAKKDFDKNTKNMKTARNELYNIIKEGSPDCELNGHPDKRLPNTLSLSFPHINANALLSEMAEVMASPGAACHSERQETSHVIEALGFKDRSSQTVRFSTGKNTTLEEMRFAGEAVLKILKGLRGRKETKNSFSPISKSFDAKEQSFRPLNVRDEKKVDSFVDTGEITLTRYTQGLGCACKMRPQVLEEILRKLPKPSDRKILVGLETNDDAAVYELNKTQAIVQTVDFFTPIVDDPEDFGEVAAANSLSDIYAMGAKPLFALNIVGFPSERLPLSVLERILKGASKKAKEAGISIIGGHTIEDTEPKYGLAVTGVADPERILTNSAAKTGDVLVLTKPIGTGIITTALKKGLADIRMQKLVIRIMAELNSKASYVMVESRASACTDITGFGLLGHCLEMAKASGVEINIYLDEVPFIEGVLKLARMAIYPGGTVSNLEYVGKHVSWSKDIDDISKILLADAQTSGGLLISIPEKESKAFLKRLKENGVKEAAMIGRVTGKGKGRITVTKR